MKPSFHSMSFAALVLALASACHGAPPANGLPPGHPADPGSAVTAFDPGPNPFDLTPTYRAPMASGMAPDRHPEHSGHDASATKSAPEDSGTKGAVRYTCPMHADVVASTPGACPKCGMTLVPLQEHARQPHGTKGSDR